MQLQHLEQILKRCSQLQLLQTDWRPAPAPAAAPDLEQQLSEDQTQQQLQFECEQAFCKAWRLRLQHR